MTCRRCLPRHQTTFRLAMTGVDVSENAGTGAGAEDDVARRRCLPTGISGASSGQGVNWTWIGRRRATTCAHDWAISPPRRSRARGPRARFPVWSRSGCRSVPGWRRTPRRSPSGCMRGTARSLAWPRSGSWRHPAGCRAGNARLRWPPRLARSSPGSSACTLISRSRLWGPLDVAGLRQAARGMARVAGVNAVLARHANDQAREAGLWRRCARMYGVAGDSTRAAEAEAEARAAMSATRAAPGPGYPGGDWAYRLLANWLGIVSRDHRSGRDAAGRTTPADDPGAGCRG